ncbi:MAG: ribonuclease H-like domain-containing protein, partial [Chloroflexota bacterium]|nr:ribonuclease H-like domain-containing protein [Chloroflexota bacterium]
LDATRAAQDAGEQLFRLRSPIEQYLIQSGRTLFKGMVFTDIRRLQVDIETTGFDAKQEDTRVIAVALRDSSGFEEVLELRDSEGDLLQQVTGRVQELDPDVIEGHNIFNFDIPFLTERASRFGVPLTWGRDGSPIRLGQNQSRFKAGPLTMPFTPAYVSGRHVIDTYQQIQRYDTAGRLSSYGLKNAVEELGLTRPGREFIPGDQIRDVWNSDRDRVLRYAIDDVRDVDILSSLATPTEFYQAQLVPRTLQAVATGGPGEKINDLMLRAYVMQNHSLPTAQTPRPYPGGHAELLEVGVFRPVVKCDVESLYPSIMLSDGITAAGDTLNAYLPMLADLTRRRLEAKMQSRTSRMAGDITEFAMWEGLQSSFKVLINSFYGYLGYGGALFNDYDAATQVTLAGQRIVKQIVSKLIESAATPIEVDTDGVYFVPPTGVDSEADELHFIDQIEAAALPAGMRLAHDGRYQGMLSLRLKNYALLDYDGAMLLRGSSLRSRRMEPYLRRFLLDAARHFLEDAPEIARDLYFSIADQIRQRALPPSDFVQWAMLNEETIGKQPRLRRLLERTSGSSAVRFGDRLEVYERDDGELGVVEEYAGNESAAYLLRRLHDVAERFRGLFATAAEFEAFFPNLTTRTDLDAARAQEASQQLSLL